MSISKIKTVVAVVAATVGLVGGSAGVVWACGGYGPRFIATPVSAAKPYPFESVETRDADNGERAWMKPMAGEFASDDKPAGAGGGIARAARFVLRNPERDITIFTDRDETFVDFFRRQRVMVAILEPKDFEAAFVKKTVLPRAFAMNASHNEVGIMNATYGSFARINPLPIAISDSLFLSERDALVLVADEVEKDLWHVAGHTSRMPTGFFASKERKGRDPFAPADLIHTPKK
jgi:hypothetical protein